MYKFCLLASLCLFHFVSFSQTPIDIAENTVKVSSQTDEVFYYGFAEGDQLVFNFEEVNGKELKEIEIMFMPSQSIYMEYKTKKIVNKTIQIRETGVYKFRFTNTNILSGRICKFKIQRIPGSEATRKFNTTVYNRTILDTSYADVQERFAVKSDTSFQEVLNDVITVHSLTNSRPNKVVKPFTLPNNTIAWAYYIGVGEEGENMYRYATKELMRGSNNASKDFQIASNPLKALILGSYSYLRYLENGEKVLYHLMEGTNPNAYIEGKSYDFIKSRKGINDYVKMDIVKNNLSFCLTNESLIFPINVAIKVMALKVDAVYDLRMVHKMNVKKTEEMYLKN
ncbi:MAG: hypothetical protein CFE25_16280 [Chitinophagaceae bacterium BSSC1]|nr:MAG: hypothetical protein CFE25_16280 [Chitinophagaceae bacterium BSSC1]